MAPERKQQAETFDGLLVKLAASKKEQAELWYRFMVGGAYEAAYHRKPTQRDAEMEIRRKMENPDPEILRWKLARVVGPLRHGGDE